MTFDKKEEQYLRNLPSCAGWVAVQGKKIAGQNRTSNRNLHKSRNHPHLQVQGTQPGRPFRMVTNRTAAGVDVGGVYETAGCVIPTWRRNKKHSKKQTGQTKQSDNEQQATLKVRRAQGGEDELQDV